VVCAEGKGTADTPQQQSHLHLNRRSGSEEDRLQIPPWRCRVCGDDSMEADDEDEDIGLALLMSMLNKTKRPLMRRRKTKTSKVVQGVGAWTHSV
jgi:hypothetical protein